MRLRQRRIRQPELRTRRMIVSPQIRRAHVARKVMFVERTVKLIRSALGNHLYLAAGRAVEIGSLIGGAYLELLDALDRRRNHARGCAACRGASGEPVTGHIGGVSS